MITGDIVVNVLDIELLSLKLRLFIASAQTAEEFGMDWWRHDPFFSGDAVGDDGRQRQLELEGRVESLERALEEERQRAR